jgi:hypothetical protein
VTATFSEAVQSATITFELRDQSGNLVPASVTYDEATRTVTLDPEAELLPLTTYTATLSGATDAAGNAMASTTWTFTVQGIWTQTTLSDFNSGAHDGTSASSEGGGALQLAPGFSDEFDGTALDTTLWGTGAWSSGNAVTVAGGVLSVQGSQVLSVSTFVDKPVEGRINFATAPYQHFGLATGFDTFEGNYWAIFSTGNTSNTLFARVNALGTSQDVNLGALPAGFHDYRIEPTSTGFKFYVDGVLQTTIAIAFPAGTHLRVALSSFNGSPTPALQADWVRIGSYASTGTYTSTVFDAGQSVNWQAVNWTASLPPGTGIQVEIQVSDNATDWSGWTEAVNGAPLSNVSGRYVRYRVTFTTTDPALTALLHDISLTWI